MKVPLQEKIAELEQRIAKLEEAEKQRILEFSVSEGKFNRDAWDRMWTNFHDVFKEMKELFR